MEAVKNSALGESAKNSKEVQVNENGRRIGQSHPRAKLTDHEVDLIRELYEELAGEGMGNHKIAEQIAAKFEVHGRTVLKIVRCERRGQTPARVKRVR